MMELIFHLELVPLPPLMEPRQPLALALVFSVCWSQRQRRTSPLVQLVPFQLK